MGLHRLYGGLQRNDHGRFTTSIAIGDETKKAYETGRWVAPSFTSCNSAFVGRLGQEHAMVPRQPMSLDICYFKPRVRFHQAEVFESHPRLLRLLTLLNGEPRFTSTESCHQTTSEPVFYTLIFRYNIGPPVVVSVARGCVPAVDNGSLQAKNGTAALALIQRYL